LPVSFVEHLDFFDKLGEFDKPVAVNILAFGAFSGIESPCPYSEGERLSFAMC